MISAFLVSASCLILSAQVISHSSAIYVPHGSIAMDWIIPVALFFSGKTSLLPSDFVFHFYKSCVLTTHKATFFNRKTFIFVLKKRQKKYIFFLNVISLFELCPLRLTLPSL